MIGSMHMHVNNMVLLIEHFDEIFDNEKDLLRELDTPLTKSKRKNYKEEETKQLLSILDAKKKKSNPS